MPWNKHKLGQIFEATSQKLLSRYDRVEILSEKDDFTPA